MRRTPIGLISVLALLFFGAFSLATRVQAQSYGTNWVAEYFNNASLSGTALEIATNIQGVNFNYGLGSPAAVIPVDNFSSRFTSAQTFNSGVYRFTIASDDGARVRIDGQLLYDQFAPRGYKADMFDFTLLAGQHTLVVEHLELMSEASIQFSWVQVSGDPGIFPTPGFFTPGVPSFPTPFGTPPATAGPTETPTRIPPTALPAIPPGALTGTVVRATVLLARSSPYFAAPVVGRVLRGQTYAVIGRDADARWFLLQLSGSQAWVWGYYLFVNGNEFNAPVQNAFFTAGSPASTTGVIGQTIGVLRLRAEPNTNSAQTGRIPWGDLLPILARTNTGWYQVIFRGTVGWVTSEFVNIIEGDVGVVPVQ